MVRIRAATVPTLIRLTAVVAVAVTVAACSSSTTPSALTSSGSSSSSSDPAHGSGSNGSSSQGGAPSSSSGTDGSNHARGSTAHKAGAGTKSRSGSSSGSVSAAAHSKSGTKSTKAGQSTTTTGIPPVPEQFEANDASFESTLDQAQTTLNHLSSGVTANQVTLAMQPLVAAAEQYQSEIINLQWSTLAKSSSQSVSENVGQLVADIDEVQRPYGFLSIGLFRSEFATAATAIRSSANKLRTELGLPPVAAS